MELLLIAVAVLGAVSPLVCADSCTYDDCIFTDIPSRYSGTEVLLLYFNINQIPDDLAQQCAILVDRAGSCESQKANCPTELEEDWESRMHDPVYVEFIMELGNDYCQTPEKLFALRDCFTEELQNNIQGCISGKYGFDFQCIAEEYNRLENCTEETDAIFFDILDKYLPNNPYIKAEKESHPYNTADNKDLPLMPIEDE